MIGIRWLNQKCSMTEILILISGQGYYICMQGWRSFSISSNFSYLAILLFRSERSTMEGHMASPHAPQTLRVANFINLLFDELLAENELHMCPTHLYTLSNLISLIPGSPVSSPQWPSICPWQVF